MTPTTPDPDPSTPDPVAAANPPECSEDGDDARTHRTASTELRRLRALLG